MKNLSSDRGDYKQGFCAGRKSASDLISEDHRKMSARIAELEAENKTLRDGWESVKRDRDDAWAERDEAIQAALKEGIRSGKLEAEVERLQGMIVAWANDHWYASDTWKREPENAALFKEAAALKPREGEDSSNAD